jgi:flagellar hook assembly protein FlgD
VRAQAIDEFNNASVLSLARNITIDTTGPTNTVTARPAALLGGADPYRVAATLEAGADWTFEVRNAAGALMFSTSGRATALNPNVNVTWNKTNQAGNPAPDGFYRWTLTATDSAGNQTSRTGNPQLDGTAPTISAIRVNPARFDPDRRNNASIRFSVNGQADIAVLIRRAANNAVVRNFPIRTIAGTRALEFLWNGRNNNGARVAVGNYEIVVRATDDAGNTRQRIANIAII